ncbi:cytochrome P450 [Sistotremastrum niveocremeum HHB9708]|uniref:Cytochrome P450 n=1 Tax=Sistotremastrum niveocremeum HHB9708 TaxID=1314777 RepID=A0A164T012_9AGAM|nr:cytochrome P450 [Sistotremastrum niveocremeum HHB9708]
MLNVQLNSFWSHELLPKVTSFRVLDQFMACVALFISYSLWRRCFSRLSGPNGEPLPPGPSPKFIIGNLKDIPYVDHWKTFANWRGEFGPIVHVRAFGTSLIAISNLKYFNELFDKRGAIYSERPVFTMAGELMSMDQVTTWMSYTKSLRTHRKVDLQALKPEAVQKYHKLQEFAAAIYLQSLAEDPLNFHHTLRRMAAKVVVAIIYGQPLTADDGYLKHAAEIMDMLNTAVQPGRYLVDLLPFLKNVPAWLPFTGFLEEGKLGRKKLMQFIYDPIEQVEREIEDGTALSSIAADLLKELPQESTEESETLKEAITFAVGTLYGAGEETTFATIAIFILAMALNPEVQSRAQEEIDRVIGHSRLPEIDDRDSLPYVTALVTELLRWLPSVRSGIPRRLLKDDVYQGVYLPKDSMICPNICITQDPELYESPETLNPERFMGPKESQAIDPGTYVFGFGRRVCPGRYLALNTIFAFVSAILATYTISKSVDEEGRETSLDRITFHESIVAYPGTFPCKFNLRSEIARANFERKLAEGITY